MEVTSTHTNSTTKRLNGGCANSWRSNDQPEVQRHNLRGLIVPDAPSGLLGGRKNLWMRMSFAYWSSLHIDHHLHEVLLLPRSHHDARLWETKLRGIDHQRLSRCSPTTNVAELLMAATTFGKRRMHGGQLIFIVIPCLRSILHVHVFLTFWYCSTPHFFLSVSSFGFFGLSPTIALPSLSLRWKLITVTSSSSACSSFRFCCFFSWASLSRFSVAPILTPAFGDGCNRSEGCRNCDWGPITYNPHLTEDGLSDAEACYVAWSMTDPKNPCTNHDRILPSWDPTEAIKRRRGSMPGSCHVDDTMDSPHF
ncbi:uncharacterized protein MYCFIDRAFT_176864 [Pseudocercospora fijiensis CIRAD86]|uniref:Uncharacterized protein n=1 Tax=Pseudocercospora fijiensis (strain CIRAD86) TaxID=383855 RepID=M2ZLB6_PSEFD|nr:uncharacterized protein MYCFIDRAFT_176864 [Pseudocercospora fijiensis CIRAD86]EME79859.1 hypothetical protein MYCFIDRAFT_176864 [Pseudocercospora fijiensis CIRAD86]